MVFDWHSEWLSGRVQNVQLIDSVCVRHQEGVSRWGFRNAYIRKGDVQVPTGPDYHIIKGRYEREKHCKPSGLSSA